LHIGARPHGIAQGCARYVEGDDQGGQKQHQGRDTPGDHHPSQYYADGGDEPKKLTQAEAE
jgi:hypothetical protein